jgi:hypothetical protein
MSYSITTFDQLKIDQSFVFLHDIKWAYLIDLKQLKDKNMTCVQKMIKVSNNKYTSDNIIPLWTSSSKKIKYTKSFGCSYHGTYVIPL